ncbi:MAG: hypothetical protein ACLFPE_07525 [Bacteroidales bacterium]
MSKALFKESQKFKQKWVIAVIAIPLSLAVWGIIQQVILGKPFGNNPAPDLALILFLVVPLLLLGFYFMLTLYTRIDREGIRYRFAPIHRTDRLIKWESVDMVHVRKYKPIAEYGGWGFRKGRSGKALNTKGNWGLQIVFKDGKKLLLGTQKPEELERVLDKLTFLQKPDH